MSEGRTAILARLRTAQRTAHIPDTAGTVRTLEPASASREVCIERFQTELLALGVENHLESDPAGVFARLCSLLEERRVLSWDAEHLPYDLRSVFEGRQVTFGASDRFEQARAEIGLTGCDAGIAETGSLVFASGPGRSRTVSLLPRVHLAVVRRADICFSMGELFRNRRDLLEGTASTTVITGPSRTADIELSLTLGVHGPGRVLVVIGP